MAPLRALAYNLHWSWDPMTAALFQRLDPALWEASNQNPIRVLSEVSQDRLRAVEKDPGFLTQIERARTNLLQELERTPVPDVWKLGKYQVAYFSFEFGIAPALPIYSGGLGILAGDHLKSASDLGLPLVGVGLHYSKGYFRQYLNSDGWQQQEFADIDYSSLPIQLLLDSNNQVVKVEVPFPGRTVTARVWKVQVGRVPLYLLDANIPENSPEDRLITDRLYGGDIEIRIQQELLLGVGGIRLLHQLGVTTAICHMNEGHSAFLGLERIRVLMKEQGLSFEEARELAAAGCVFTTHTPVPAGIDLFTPEMIDRYFNAYWPELGLSRDQFLALGRQNPNDPNEPFSMAVLGIHLSSFVNGVSKLHGAVSRTMWRGLWPEVPENEIPIHSVTNGIHHRTWVTPDLANVFDRYLGEGWFERPADPDSWAMIDQIPDEELWRTHARYRERLVAFARKRYVQQLRSVGASQASLDEAGGVLDPEALTIGFSRRFAKYKRATLLFRDPDRLARLLDNKDRPVQLVISGKAHPQDEPAKALIREIIHLIRRPDMRRRIVFVENYDIIVARHLVQGSDIWLNTPLRPQEASGTSGMKAALNGVLNLSILDGWWAEAYKPGNGWAIGGQETYPSVEEQDAIESELLYDLLEEEVIPTFYDRTRDNVPRGWLRMMKQNIRELASMFNTDRMVLDYLQDAYIPSVGRSEKLVADGQRAARDLASWKASLTQRWNEVAVIDVESNTASELVVGSHLTVKARVRLGSVQPDEVLVQAYYGPVDGRRQVANGSAQTLVCTENDGDGTYRFEGEIEVGFSGTLGYGVRVIPRNPNLANEFEPRLIRWS